MKKSNQRKNNSISKRVKNINYSSVRKSFAAGSGKDIINATIGRPDFDVPNEIKEQAKLFIDGGRNAYTETKGILPLRQAISNHLQQRKIKRTADEIIVTAGTTSSIFMVIFSLINPDDEVIIFEPYFVAYPEIVKMINGKCVIIKTDKNFQPNIDTLRKAVTEKTKLIILNSPNNPTGAVYPVETIKSIVRIAKKMSTYILSDEIYHDFIYGETTHYSAAEIYDKTVIVDGLSKSKGMSGWRIGFVAGPKNIIDAVEKVQQFTSVCAPAPFQYAAISAFADTLAPSILEQYKQKRDSLVEGIKNDYQVIIPDGAFYLFLKTPVPADKFVKTLIKKGLAVVPGYAFGNYKNFIRISYAVNDREIMKMIEILKNVAKEK
ncbi:aminotransferase class I/II-fold pyridoxal phosphate-dependent enzyme [Patescibacteria group bacterium]|nr:aminotransferase class I/II-fold pyridoxal phosphate-dependent enzyme [Patescibacteria group bacterium]MBU1933931.1 aminotransferase class I/II-fold pyridoxal phosphate-dependent enzyme [Patescibacteria group bacterium]MBU2264487.1 aminotransferase class I/II-fold pyridoxal phosphate-dependent enzyme [Patescibacteria group bacterium]